MSSRLLYLVTEDWYFISHRLPMARAARDAGYEVHVACRVGRHADDIAAEGFTLHALPWSRSSRGAATLAGEVRAIRRLYRELRPLMVHQVALKPVILGSLASTGHRIGTVNSVAGLGSGFIASGLVAALRRQGLSTALKALLNRPLAITVVQNPDDRTALEGLGVRPDRLALIPGSGVDVDLLRPLPEPEGPITVGFAGRLLADKGVAPLVEAAGMLRRDRPDLRLLLAGTPDPSNPASIPPAEIERWRGLPGVELLGHVSDIASFWSRCHIAVLPSRREGLPKALLEAAALGRPLVATNVPGCREVAREGVNGILVPVDDAQALAQAIGRLADESDLRRRYAAAGRTLVEAEFSAVAIGKQTLAVYDRLTKGHGIAPPRRSL
jgi:glycosyltransferase involved in cell wall biosynthesis